MQPNSQLEKGDSGKPPHFYVMNLPVLPYLQELCWLPDCSYVRQGPINIYRFGGIYV